MLDPLTAGDNFVAEEINGRIFVGCGWESNAAQIAEKFLADPASGCPGNYKALLESVEAFMQRVAQVDITRCTCCAHGRFHIIGVIAPVRMPFRYATRPLP